MEFLKTVRRRSFLSEVIYVGLNIALAVAVVTLIWVTESPWAAVGLVLLSKWRVFAVRPRYWFVNVQSNLVDFIVSVSFVIFLYTTYSSIVASGPRLFIMAVLTLIYIGWLLFLKPRSKRSYMVAQGATALFVGVTALYLLAYALPTTVVVMLMWLIGYTTARHILSSYSEETHILFMSQLWAITLAEIGWLAYHWTVGYSLFGVSGMVFPRVALTVACIGFITWKCYDAYYHNRKIRRNDIILPILFTVGIIIVLPLILNSLGTSVPVGI
jgi:hypothetical protein